MLERNGKLVPDGSDAGVVGADVVGFQGFGVDDAYAVQFIGGAVGLAAEGDLACATDEGCGVH